MAIDRLVTHPVNESLVQAMTAKMSPDRVDPECINGGLDPVNEDRFTKLLAMRFNGKPVDLRMTGDTPLNRVLDQLSLDVVIRLSTPVQRSRGSFSL